MSVEVQVVEIHSHIHLQTLSTKIIKLHIFEKII